MNTDKLCQSCAMPLNEKGLDVRGSEKDGSKSNKFCFHCYQNGEYVAPNMTVDEMIAIGIDASEKSDANFFKKFLLKKTYPMLVKQLERWR